MEEQGRNRNGRRRSKWVEWCHENGVWSASPYAGRDDHVESQLGQPWKDAGQRDGAFEGLRVFDESVLIVAVVVAVVVVVVGVVDQVVFGIAVTGIGRLWCGAVGAQRLRARRTEPLQFGHGRRHGALGVGGAGGSGGVALLHLLASDAVQVRQRKVFLLVERRRRQVAGRVDQIAAVRAAERRRRRGGPPAFVQPTAAADRRFALLLRFFGGFERLRRRGRRRLQRRRRRRRQRRQRLRRRLLFRRRNNAWLATAQRFHQQVAERRVPLLFRRRRTGFDGRDGRLLDHFVAAIQFRIAVRFDGGFRPFGRRRRRRWRRRCVHGTAAFQVGANRFHGLLRPSQRAIRGDYQSRSTHSHTHTHTHTLSAGAGASSPLEDEAPFLSFPARNEPRKETSGNHQRCTIFVNSTGFRPTRRTIEPTPTSAALASDTKRREKPTFGLAERLDNNNSNNRPSPRLATVWSQPRPQCSKVWVCRAPLHRQARGLGWPLAGRWLSRPPSADTDQRTTDRFHSLALLAIRSLDRFPSQKQNTRQDSSNKKKRPTTTDSLTETSPDDQPSFYLGRACH